MYLVALHLTGDAGGYEPLNASLQKLGDWSNRIPNGWLVQSTRSSRELRDTLKPHLGPNDRLIVAQIARNWAATNMGAGFAEWMGRRSFDAPASQPVLPAVVTPLSFSSPPTPTAPRGPKTRPGVKPR